LKPPQSTCSIYRAGGALIPEIFASPRMSGKTVI
jgi:hypothetical protein